MPSIGGGSSTDAQAWEGVAGNQVEERINCRANDAWEEVDSRAGKKWLSPKLHFELPNRTCTIHSNCLPMRTMHLHQFVEAIFQFVFYELIAHNCRGRTQFRWTCSVR
jgi:hypothetical protein